MITSIRTRDGEKVLARDSAREDGPFRCPKCDCPTILHKGLVKTHHFAHKPPVSCQYGQGESEAHRACKQALFDALSMAPGVSACELEKDLGPVVPDVYFVRAAIPVAVEVQISTLTMERVIERTAAYRRLGVYVLWLPIMDEVLGAPSYAPRQWEKWLHAAYYGRVYYWLEGLKVACVHFAEQQLWVGESYWQDSGGPMQAGGYFHRSKRGRTPIRGPDLHLLDDFRAAQRAAWQSGDIAVPACRLWRDTRPAWW